MKLIRVAVVLGGAASAVLADPDFRGDAAEMVAAQALTTSTVLTTSVFTVIKCGSDVTDCPESGTEIVTSVVAFTTTICPVSSTPVDVTVPVVTSGSLTPGKPIDPTSSVVSTAPPNSSVLPTTPGVPGNSSVFSASSSHDSFTDAVPTSALHPSSGVYSAPVDPTASTKSSVSPSGSQTPSTGGATNSEGIATSSASSKAYTPADPSSASSASKDPSATTSEGIATSAKSTAPAATSSDTPTTIHLTSVITRTLTSVITRHSTGASGSSFVPTTAVITETLTSIIVTKPASKNESATPGPSTNIEATTTSWGTVPSGGPSGFPNVTINGTVSIPTPSIPPFEDAADKMLGASVGSLTAIVVAFIFALYV